uniref:Uncharacterized protein n=1 Tax=Leptobrachium leishanense TaxID=445787 RepID=A0A8C5LU46_9ANUR
MSRVAAGRWNPLPQSCSGCLHCPLLACVFYVESAMHHVGGSGDPPTLLSQEGGGTNVSCHSLTLVTSEGGTLQCRSDSSGFRCAWLAGSGTIMQKHCLLGAPPLSRD